MPDVRVDELGDQRDVFAGESVIQADEEADSERDAAALAQVMQQQAPPAELREILGIGRVRNAGRENTA